MALWPVMGMLDRISEHAVTICMLGSYRWNNNASKSCSHTHTLVMTTKEIYCEGSLYRRPCSVLHGSAAPEQTSASARPRVVAVCIG